jgi:hypothetical protein
MTSGSKSLDVNAKHLVVLVADGQMDFALRGLLARGQSLGIPELSYDIYVHPEKDPGCLLRGHDFLRPFCRQYLHALVMLDREGCGREASARETLEAELQKRLSDSGWDDRAEAIVIDPELEVWVWSDSPQVDVALGWTGRQPKLIDWLVAEHYLAVGQQKPARPQEALERALRVVRKVRSSSIFFELASQVSIKRCTDPAFGKLKQTLVKWFGGQP